MNLKFARSPFVLLAIFGGYWGKGMGICILSNVSWTRNPDGTPPFQLLNFRVCRCWNASVFIANENKVFSHQTCAWLYRNSSISLDTTDRHFSQPSLWLHNILRHAPEVVASRQIVLPSSYYFLSQLFG